MAYLCFCDGFPLIWVSQEIQSVNLRQICAIHCRPQ